MTKAQKLPARHPINYMWDRYKTFQRLLVIGAPYQTIEVGENKIPTVIWTLDKGVTIGLYEDILDLILECKQPGAKFKQCLEDILFDWETNKEFWKDTDFNSAGIWVDCPEMEFIVNCKVKSMFYNTK